jgi:hypothetical protein
MLDKPLLQLLDQIHGAVLTAGATDSYRDITAMVFFERWQPLV